ncbi:hypothetical protein HDU99_007376, partial [Rhizoclosmatium hyalinum]
MNAQLILYNIITRQKIVSVLLQTQFAPYFNSSLPLVAAVHHRLVQREIGTLEVTLTVVEVLSTATIKIYLRAQ